MMELIIAVLFIMLFFGILKAAFKFAWGATLWECLVICGS